MLMAINGTGISFSTYDPLTRYEVEIPDQDVSAYYETRDVGGHADIFFKPAIFPAGLQLFSAEEKALRLDKDTGTTISTAVHPFAGTDEQIGILRDQMARILNGDLTPSDDFLRLNDIAIAAIEEGRAKKEAL